MIVADRPSEPSLWRSSLRLVVIANVGSIFNLLFQWLAVRSLSSADYGVLGSVLAWITYLTLPGYALQLAFSRRFTTDLVGDDAGALKTNLRAAMQSIGFLGALYLALALAFGPTLTQWQSWPDATLPMFSAAVATSLLLFQVGLGALQALRAFVVYGACQVGLAVLRFTFAGGAAAAGFGVRGVLIASIAVALVAAVPGLRAMRRAAGRLAGANATGDDGHVEFVRLIADVSPFVGTFGMLLAMTQIDIVVVQALFAGSDHGASGGIDAGHYQAAAILGRSCFHLPLAVTTVGFAHVARAHAAGESHHRILRQKLIATTALSLAIGAPLYCLAEPVLTLYGGAAYRGASDILERYVIAMSLLSLANVFVSYAFASGRRLGVGIIVTLAFATMVVILPASPTPQAVIDRLTLAIAVLVVALAILAACRGLQLAAPSGVDSTPHRTRIEEP